MLKYKDLSERQEMILSSFGSEWKLSSDIISEFKAQASVPTIKRDIKLLFDRKLLERAGAGRATKYRFPPQTQLLQRLDIENYFAQNQDERGRALSFNFKIFQLLGSFDLFTTAEKRKLTVLKKTYQKNIQGLSAAILKREFERVTIDLSWKSASIEGNTYTLLETEALLKDGISAPGRTKDETNMILNHKVALDFIKNNASNFKEISVKKIENIHDLLTANLQIPIGIRKRIVGITGTNYRPLDNEFQILDALEKTCALINKCDEVFSKSLLALLLISYIQPFEDGNKRSARLLGNAVLLADNCFPLSFRSARDSDYKKAILLFYETNNLAAFKEIFLDQAEFAVSEYFR